MGLRSLAMATKKKTTKRVAEQRSAKKPLKSLKSRKDSDRKTPRSIIAPQAPSSSASADLPLHSRIVVVEDDRTGLSAESIKEAFLDHLRYSQGVDLQHSSAYDRYMALAYVVRDRLVHRWITTRYASREQNAKRVCYLSGEFLMGKQLLNNLLNICSFVQARQALNELGISIHELLEQEPEPALGNGGLGRLAACFLDSLSTLDLPAIGYGIRYEYGIFEQRIENGWQLEAPDKWLRYGNPWEIERPRRTLELGFGGHTEIYHDENGQQRTRWLPAERILGTPYDTMIPGFTTNMVNTLRLWAAGTTNDFDFQIFDAGDYVRAVDGKTHSENISKVLYPNDNTPQGRELRLRQQYFFVSCSLQDIIRRHLESENSLYRLPDKVAIQLNDTHPAVAVPELLRLLLDVHGLPWDDSWNLVQKTIAYTNHTLLPEALECWPVSLFGRLLPRHLELVYEINRRHLEEVSQRFPGDIGRLSRLSIIEEAGGKSVRMAHLASVGSHAVNGVAELHTELLKTDVLRDLYEFWPQKFSNKTNGVTPRRWLLLCNPKLTYLITEKIGRAWLRNLEELRALEPLAEDAAFQGTWDIFNYENKLSLAQFIETRLGIVVSPDSLFDVHVKRLHEYKRQLLNVLHIISLYLELKDRPTEDFVPRTFIFGAKAAPGYFMAKLIIKLIHSVAAVINGDPAMHGLLNVVFMPNFSVSLGEKIYPAADLSEQISTAGKEASGTGNMKFALNGALTIGTLDGANIEIRNAVGAENFFLFGHTVQEISEIRSRGYNPRDYLAKDHVLQSVLEALASGLFSEGDKQLFLPILDSLYSYDPYFTVADFSSYRRAQAEVSATFKDRSRWNKMSILNVARMGFFSSDRTISEYVRDIWHVRPIDAALLENTRF